MDPQGKRAAWPPAVGTTLAGKYRVDGVLGEGGMGVVLEATHLHLREKVAIKLLHPSRLVDAAAVERFMREARAASRIRGEHVVRVHDVGLLDDASPYLVMERLAGVDLAAHLARQGRLPVAEAVGVVLQACEALAEAHARGIVHRDLKPANIFLARRADGSPCVKVLDFGVSKTPEALGAPLDENDHAEAPPRALADTLDGPAEGRAPEHRELAARPYDLTRSGAALGSPRYMAPEQMSSPRTVDARADVWSLGAVLFELVTGRPAFAGESLRAVRGDVQNARFSRVRDLVPGAPPALDEVLARCLARDPRDRFAGVEDLARALAPLAAGRRRPRAARVAVAALAACVATAAVVVLVRRGGFGGARAAASSPDAARAEPPTLTVGAPVIPFAHGGDCAELPAFASDGSVVYLVRRGVEEWIERAPPGEHGARTLVSCAGACFYPAPGGEGRVAFAAAADATSLGLEVRSVALDGGDPRVEAARGRSAWRAGPSLLFVREDLHAILRHAADGSADETLVESPSARTFRALAASPDGTTIAVTSTGLEARIFADVCFGPASPGAALDCRSAGESSAQRPSFAPNGRAFYLARGRTLVRFDPDTHARQTATLPFAPSSLAVAPSGDRLVASSCEPSLAVARWTKSGTLTALPPIERAANELAVGPHGELAYPVVAGEDVQLVVADESGEHTRVLTSGPRRVSEAAFSPDGRRVAFQDGGATSPGIFVVDASGARAPTRLTTDAGDCEIAWLDDDRLVYMHPEPGYAYGRMQSVATSGGVPEPLAIGDGILLGVDRARRALLLVDWDADGTRFFERTLDGRVRELVFAGAPPRASTSFSGVSVSGRYLTWVGGGGAWLGDMETMRAVRLPELQEGRVLAVYADDEGRALLVSKVRRGGLYEIPGTFP